MNKFEVEKIVYETLEKAGYHVPVELKFDYTGLQEQEKAMEFVRLVQGNWRNAIYVEKQGEKYGDRQYYDLLFVVNERGEPVCIPVPIAKQLFGEWIRLHECTGCMLGAVYETIYRRYYQEKHLPF